MVPAPDSDPLLSRWNAGDGAAGAELAMAEADWLRGRIRRARGEALARDVETVDQLQDVLAEVLAYRPRFAVQSRRQFRALLARMIENDLADKARRAQARPGKASHAQLSESRVALAPDPRPSAAPDAAAAKNEDIAWLRLGVDFLPDEARQLILTHVFDGETFTAMAERDGGTADAVRMRFNRAMVKLGGIVQRLQGGEVDAMLDAPE